MYVVTDIDIVVDESVNEVQRKVIIYSLHPFKAFMFWNTILQNF
jgi:hypothetical protein